MQHHRWGVLALAILALGLWALYLRTLSPAFPPDDSPETVAAAATLGIQHPPGYPLACLAGRLAVVGLGLGGPAWRVNLLSAGLAVAVALLAGILAWRLAGQSWPAFVLTALAVGTWKPFWLQATEAKGGIYLLTLLLGLATLHLAMLLWERLGDDRWAAWTGLLAGLCLAAHFLMAAPFLAAALALAWPGPGRKGRLMRLGLWILPGLSLYLYLPLRARLWPAVDLGHPADLGQFWWMLSRAGYTQAGVGARGAIAAAQTRLWWTAWLEQWLAWAPLLALLGWRQIRRSAAWPAWSFAAAWAWSFAAGAWLNKTTELTRFLAQIFLLPADLLIFVLAGVGAAALVSAWAWRPAVALGCALALALVSGAKAFGQADRSASFLAYDFAHDLALCLPRGSLYFGEGDFHVLPLYHLRAVGGRRQDLAVVVVDLAGQPWHQAQAQRLRPDAPAPVKGEDTASALAWAAAAPPPVLASAYGQRMDGAGLARAGLAARQWGLARALKLGAGAPPAFEQAWALRAPGKPAADWEPLERQLLPWYAVALVQAGNEASERDPGRAARLYARALGIKGELPYGPITFNLGLALERAGRLPEARAAYARAVELDPGFAPARERLRAFSTGAERAP